jgi:hypothetical protein
LGFDFDQKSPKRITPLFLFTQKILHQLGLGILPERRKDPRRITEASVMKWAEMLLDNHGSKKVFFTKGQQ